MPVVAPKVKVVRVSGVPSSNIRGIDLGMVLCRNAAIYGLRRALVPYSSGRLIRGIEFVLGGVVQPTSNGAMFFSTPINCENFGFAWLQTSNNGGLSDSQDTLGLFFNAQLAGIAGLQGSANTTVPDCGPLIACIAIGSGSSFWGVETWAANTKFCLNDSVLDINDHIQSVTTAGTSGGSLPIFDTGGGTTSDGTITWTDEGLVTGGQVHAIADVIEGISPMPPSPTTLEFVTPPVNAVAGAPMTDFTVIIKDQFGDPYTQPGQNPGNPNLGHSMEVHILGAGTLSGTTTIQTDPTTAIGTFTGLSIAEAANGYVLRVRCVEMGVGPIFSDPFNITP